MLALILLSCAEKAEPELQLTWEGTFSAALDIQCEKHREYSEETGQDMSEWMGDDFENCESFLGRHLLSQLTGEPLEDDPLPQGYAGTCAEFEADEAADCLSQMEEMSPQESYDSDLPGDCYDVCEGAVDPNPG